MPESASYTPESFRTRNSLALGSLIVGKILGVIGLIVGVAGYRTLGATFLVLDGVLLVTAVVLCLRNMRGRAKEEASHKQMLAQMIREGTLNQYLRDLENEKRQQERDALNKDDEGDETPSALEDGPALT